MSVLARVKTLMPTSLKPPGYVTAALVASLAGFMNGYDTGTIGAVTVMQSFEDSHGVLSPFMRGFTVSIAMLAGALPAFVSGQMSDRYGQLRALSIGSVFLGVGNLIEGIAPNLGIFIFGRVLAGLGQGITVCIIPVYICEIAPAKSRGALVSLPQMFVTSAICLGYFTCYGTVKIQGSMSWRIPYIIQVLGAIALGVGCMFVPSSPRWLMSKQRRDEALKAVEKLGIMRAEAEKDILREPTAVDMAQKSNPIQDVILIFRDQYRMRTSLALLILAGIQLSGIDGIIYYAPLLFRNAGLPERTAGFLASGVSAILMTVITIPAVLLADRWGRRTSLISGGILLASCMYIMGSLFAAGRVTSGSPAAYTVIVLIFVFALTYCTTWAIAGKIYASEIQPARTRASANSVAQALGFFTNGLVALITPIFLAKSTYGAYFMFGTITLAMVGCLTLFMPETRGEPLEAIDEIFSKPLLRGWSWSKKMVSAVTNNSVADIQSQNGSDAAIDRETRQGSQVSTNVAPSLENGTGRSSMDAGFELQAFPARPGLGL